MAAKVCLYGVYMETSPKRGTIWSEMMKRIHIIEDVFKGWNVSTNTTTWIAAKFPLNKKQKS